MNPKYNPEMREKVINQRKKGLSQRDIARQLGISQSTVKHYLKESNIIRVGLENGKCPECGADLKNS